ncbi:sialic acid-binding Ig-like lectin 9 [Carassius auratus]|uniref:Sialic acid-binding Ig-like lectin 9 n=1 Tax=Carassius auratus TaxID=7957 RepID=A0A6P6MWL0_CARAU|nr:sialic acid-binding Ig-like lectin 9 [Carassius auratus]
MMNIPLLREGEKADLTCSAPFPCPETPNITWWIRTRGGNITYLKDNITPSTSKSLYLSTLTLTPTSDDHNATVGCNVSYGSKLISTNRTLNVTYIFMNQASVGSVTITTVTKEHAGVYSCMRTFQNKTLNASITLNIICK